MVRWPLLGGDRYSEVYYNEKEGLGLKVNGRSREVAAIRRWPHLEVRLYIPGKKNETRCEYRRIRQTMDSQNNGKTPICNGADHNSKLDYNNNDSTMEFGTVFTVFTLKITRRRVRCFNLRNKGWFTREAGISERRVYFVKV